MIILYSHDYSGTLFDVCSQSNSITTIYQLELHTTVNFLAAWRWLTSLCAYSATGNSTSIDCMCRLANSIIKICLYAQ